MGQGEADVLLRRVQQPNGNVESQHAAQRFRERLEKLVEVAAGVNHIADVKQRLVTLEQGVGIGRGRVSGVPLSWRFRAPSLTMNARS